MRRGKRYIYIKEYIDEQRRGEREKRVRGERRGPQAQRPRLCSNLSATERVSHDHSQEMIA